LPSSHRWSSSSCHSSHGSHHNHRSSSRSSSSSSRRLSVWQRGRLRSCLTCHWPYCWQLTVVQQQGLLLRLLLVLPLGLGLGLQPAQRPVLLQVQRQRSKQPASHGSRKKTSCSSHSSLSRRECSTEATPLAARRPS
jgi:hypothetical protein